MHAEISLSYGADKAIQSLDPARYRILYENCPWLDLPQPQPQSEEEWKNSKWSYYSIRDQVVELEKDARTLTECEIRFEVKKFKNTYHVADHEHTHIHVAIPNIGLLMIDEVQLLDDACTDRLQQELKDGWRILAVCPPNAQRRPDYILGRASTDDNRKNYR